MPNMTDAEIDGLSGFQLDEAMKRAGAFQPASMCSPPLIGKWSAEPHPYHDDIGAAFALLLEFDGISWIHDRRWREGLQEFSVFRTHINRLNNREFQLIATGPKSEAASILCRAWLKLKAREA